MPSLGDNEPNSVKVTSKVCRICGPTSDQLLLNSSKDGPNFRRIQPNSLHVGQSLANFRRPTHRYQPIGARSLETPLTQDLTWRHPRGGGGRRGDARLRAEQDGRGAGLREERHHEHGELAQCAPVASISHRCRPKSDRCRPSFEPTSATSIPRSANTWGRSRPNFGRARSTLTGTGPYWPISVKVGPGSFTIEPMFPQHWPGSAQCPPRSSNIGRCRPTFGRCRPTFGRPQPKFGHIRQKLAEIVRIVCGSHWGAGPTKCRIRSR